tara:strand:+ start:182 stop:382 length:201 start_codon:yes stop_codon:yes gene_type:complete
MSTLDISLNSDESIRDFYSKVFIASYLKSISHDSINDKDLETAANQAQRIAEVATRLRASSDTLNV